jgi:DNA polymerase II
MAPVCLESPAMAALRGMIVHSTYRVREEAPVVQLFGRLEDGRPFLVEDQRFRPAFFVPRGQEGPLAREADLTLEETELVDLGGRPVLRAVARLPGDVPRLRARVEQAGGEALEADVRFASRFLIDHGIRAELAIEGEAEPWGAGGLRFVDPALAPAEARVSLSTLSLDLETSPDASRIFSAALVGCGVEEVHLVARRPVAGAVVHGDERALLAALVARLRALDPDVLLGWAVVDFDLRVLLRRCEACGVACAIGRSDEPPRILQEHAGMRGARAELPGRVVLDGIPLVREALRLPDYRLETVARQVLGRGKKIDQEAPDAAAEIARMWREDPEALVSYNLEDARLVPEILAREGLLALAIERSRLSGMPLDRVSASIASFDRLVLPELRRRGFVAPSARADRDPALVRGGALLEPAPGLHRGVAVFDFKSLYPSLIRTFHLDPLAHARAREDGDALEAPNGARFSRREALLPAVIEHLMERRAAARARGERHADQALKIMMNALFGVLGAPGCRFFDPAIANAITGFGQQTLRWTREAFEAAGLRVLYGDTDSVFVALPEGLEGAAAEDAAQALRREAEARVASRIRAAYRVEPRLALELQRVFARLWLPRVRGGRAGSKKRYAGWASGRLVTVGLEAVRRDWPEVAQRLQEGMLERLFTDRPVAPFVRGLVERVRAGELDAKLVYAKRLRKGDLARYTATTPPHVQAARRAGVRVGPVVRYVITREGPQPVLPGRALPPGIDRAHYVERVLRPVAESLLSDLGSSFDEALGSPRQLSLL